MTRKDFNLIAEAMKTALAEAKLCDGREDAVGNAAHCLAERLRGTNGAFDTDRFLRACGVEPHDMQARTEPLLDRA